MPDLDALSNSDLIIAGFDEVGRGCLVGAVVAAAVILDKKKPIPGLTDSKKLTPKQRLILAKDIKTAALAWSIGRAEPSEIDRINILQASLLAMQRAFAGLSVKPNQAYIDGNICPDLPCPMTAVVGGDRLIPEISAASIIAKVHRDEEMQFLDRIYPGYDFAQHKGYPTQLHRQNLDRLGITELHRTSYAPVMKLMKV